MEVVEGYHVDILAHEMIEELKPYCLEKAPENPIHGTGWAENDFIMVTKQRITNTLQKTMHEIVKFTEGFRPAILGWTGFGLAQILANLNAILTTIALLLTISVTAYSIIEKVRKAKKAKNEAD